MEVGLAVGGVFLSSALNVFFDRMTPKFPNLFRGRKADDQLLKKLKRTLFVIELVLDDAEDKQNRNKHVEKWLSELKTTVYHAEDLMDEINTETLRLEIEDGEESEESMTNRVNHFSDEFLKDIIPKIKEVVNTLEDFATQINDLGLGRRVTKKDNSYRLPSTSLVDESSVYGRDKEREKLIDMVLSDYANGNNVTVIPIVGMGGVGKTTLAQILYGDERVMKHFEKRSWVCVSENYDAFEITRTLLNETPNLGYDFDRLQVKLKESLTEKKFLIVLDDVWNDNYNDWDKLKAPLKYGKQGSKIILTTRNEKVAFMVRIELPIHHLNPISDEDCWLLFKKHAFDNLASPEFEKIGKEIVKKCKGLPLAIMTLGGLMRSKTEVKEWDDISTSQFWTSENNPHDVLPVLQLSYHHLPPHLKHCFAYCALFPKNYELEEEELVLLWMANDLLQHPTRNDKSLEDMGYEYISELRSRSLFQRASDGKYVMHDLVNDLARYVSKKFCVRYEHYQHQKIPSEVRHLSYMSESVNAFQNFKYLVQLKGLRTFLPLRSRLYSHKIPDTFSSHVLAELKCLRVLCLSDSTIKEVSGSICNLKHLRYVTLSGTSIKLLPDGICSLHNLQTLKLSQCGYLHELPMNLSKLVNLRHLELIGTYLKEMPSHMGRLKSLQTLTYFIVDRSPGRGIEELESLNLHGYLKIKGLQNVISCNEAAKANIRYKKHLQDLVLEWSGDTDDSQSDRDILDKLQPHTTLKTVTINGYSGTRFPDWFADDSYCNIVSLSISNCRNCFSLPAIGHLSALKSLTIKRLVSITKIGQEFHGDASLIKPFKSLMSLRIEDMFELQEWDTSRSVDFSCLETLYMKDCPKLLGKLPSQLLCLKRFEIFGCPLLVFPDDWNSMSEQLSSMEFLSISDMPNLKELPSRLRLKNLSLRRCDNILSLPKVLNLNIYKCEHLKVFPLSSGIQTLTKIEISYCDNLLSFPKGGLPAPNLESFWVSDCKKLNSLPEEMHSLNPSLRYLWIEDCPEIESFPEGGLPFSLQCLYIAYCEKLITRRGNWGLQNLPALREFSISDDKEESFPEEWLLPSSLKLLGISRNKNLKTLNEEGLLRLKSLETLSISYCPKLLLLPLVGLPPSLSNLWINNCPLLKPHLERERGKYWPGISYIPHIRVDSEVIS